MFAVTSGDVLHSFAIPTLGIKIDAVPGKDNSVFCAPIIPGLFFGNCSEICGVNHSVIPIGIVVDNALLSVDKSQAELSLNNSFGFFKKNYLARLRCVEISLIVNQTLYNRTQHFKTLFWL